MKQFFKYIILVAALHSSLACSKPFSHSPYGENDGVAPGPVTVTIKTRNRPNVTMTLQ